jgi:hypothetical protein
VRVRVTPLRPRRVRAMPWASDASAWPLLRAPRRPRMAARRLRPLAAAEPWYLLAALWALAAVLAGATVLDGIAPHDEGLVLQAGQRIAGGQLPYRDFWANYGPGQLLLVGALAKTLGPSLLAWRLVRVGLVATVALLAFLLARPRAPLGWALAAWAGAAGAMAFPASAGPNPAALALGLGAVALARRAPAGAGALAGAAALFRPELGAAAALGAMIAAGRGAAARAGVAAVVAAALLYLPFVIAAPAAIVDQTVGFLGLQHLQRLPFPLGYDGPTDASKLLEFYGPALLLSGLGVWALDALARLAPPEEWALAPLALGGAAYLLSRTDEFHLAPLAVVLAPMLAVAAAQAHGAARRTVLTLALVLVLAQSVERQLALIAHPAGDRSPALAAADGVRAPAGDAAALEATARFVDARVPAGAPIFVANPRHDLVHVGDPLLYVLLERPNPTRYDVMQPGVVTTAPVQREIVANLRRTRPRIVVRWLDPTASLPEPNAAGRSSGVRILDAYLSAAYRPVARFGAYQLLAPRSLR